MIMSLVNCYEEMMSINHKYRLILKITSLLVSSDYAEGQKSTEKVLEIMTILMKN